VIGLVAANLAMPLCSGLISLGNAFTGALTDGPVAGPDAARQVVRIAFAALNTGGGPTRLLVAVIVLLILVLTGDAAADLDDPPRRPGGAGRDRAGALACQGLPQLDGIARLWWRSMLATWAPSTCRRSPCTPGHRCSWPANLAALGLRALGLPGDPTGIVNLFIVVCLLWTTVKIPSLMARYATHHSGRTRRLPRPGRPVLVQQLARAARR
jgi:hypothetical protein